MAPKLSPSQLAALDKMIAAFEVGRVSFNIGGPVGINIGYRPVDFW